MAAAAGAIRGGARPSTGINLSGGQVGGTAGYNWQFGNTVLGLEGDMDWSRFKRLLQFDALLGLQRQ